MDNALHIEGRRTGIINPNTGHDLDLRAVYKDTEYSLSGITGMIPSSNGSSFFAWC